MTKKFFVKVGGLLLLTFWVVTGLMAQPNSMVIPYGNNQATGKYLTFEGARLYYEVYGQGDPLLLIHGNGGNIGYMAPQIEFFSKKYKVIVMDCRGRGKSELGKDSLTYHQMTRDINGLLNKLNLDSVYLVGRSDGGIIALMMAIYFPRKVKKAVVFAANLSPDTMALYPSFYNEVLSDRRQADQMLANNDTTQNWKVIQQRNRLMEFQPRLTALDLHQIKCPILIASTDRDIVKEEHTLFIYRNISKANLCIFTGEDHYITKNNPALFNSAVMKYFTEPYRGK